MILGQLYRWEKPGENGPVDSCFAVPVKGNNINSVRANLSQKKNGQTSGNMAFGGESRNFYRKSLNYDTLLSQNRGMNNIVSLYKYLY